MNRVYMLVGSSVVGSFTVGVTVGWYITKSNLTTRYDEMMKEELEKTREFYSKANKVEEFSTPEEAAKKLIPEKELVVLNSLRTYQGHAPKEPVVTVTATIPETTAKNIFAEQEESSEVGLERRDPNYPYIISDEVFHANDEEYTQAQLTLYADGVLCDASDDPLEMVNKIIGDNNLTRFGELSGDPNMLYVRNESIRTDFEITTDDRTYKSHVLGLED